MLISQTFIVAVSGGVDSVVLLHKLMQNKPDQVTYVVAHFDHGIREDSREDATFVQTFAKDLQLECVIGEGKLGPQASEEQARDARYAFLRQVAHDHQAEKIIVAHHEDDVLETMVLNMIRGTSPRGLSPMSGQSDILRPLLRSSKQDILQYADDHELSWREDPSNTDEKYLRNYIRKNITPKLEPARQQLIDINERIDELYTDIDIRMNLFLPKKNMLSRSWFVQLPYSVQRELMHAWLVRCNIKDISHQMVQRLVVACKTLEPGKKVDVNGQLWLVSQQQNLLLTSKT